MMTPASRTPMSESIAHPIPDAAPGWQQRAAGSLARRREQHLYRHRYALEPIDAAHVRLNGRRLVNFCSNNYLGLTHHPRILAAARLAIARDGLGSGAAPLISGYTSAHESAERAIADWKGTQSAILLPSGYQANFAAIQTAAAIGKLGAGARFLVDKLAHASLIDAIRATGEPLRVFPHNGINKLRRLLAQAPPEQLQVVVTESIFSMDGDAADLPAIAVLKENYNFMLLLDEAHATGVYGPAGAGLAGELGLRDAVDVSIITLSKAMGGIGGAVCGSALFCDTLVNHARAYLFSTAIPPSVAAVAESAIAILRDEPAHQRRVRALALEVRARLADGGLSVPPGDSPIIPIIIGQEQAALEVAERLANEGLLVIAVRPPTVAVGSSRLRITLSSAHTDQEIELLVSGLLTHARHSVG